MSAYAEVDGVIDAWVKATGSKLFTEWADAPARFFYLPGDPPFEIFQVSVSLPRNGQTTVSARAIDTNDDSEEEMDQTWDGPVAQLDEMLGVAIDTIKGWKGRERKRRTRRHPGRVRFPPKTDAGRRRFSTHC
jgi:hypothetical protein